LRVITFKNDVSLRKKLMCPEAFSHPAKANMEMMAWIINAYTERGDRVMDPMSGSGSTSLVGAALGRDCTAVELETRFCDLILKSMYHMAHGYMFDLGDIKLVKGDARKLVEMFGEGDSNGHGFHSVIFSPPYGDMLGTKGRESGAFNRRLAKERPKMFHYLMGQYDYFSPANLGTMKSYDVYLEGMIDVYEQCYKVIIPGGKMVLITKNYIKERKEIMLDEDTINMCEQVGFVCVERLKRTVPKSIWTNLYEEHTGMQGVRFEDIIVFERPL
jgi:DNA modification methylase